MKRREFITLIGSASAAWPLAVRAQQPASAGRRLGLLLGTSAEAFKSGGMLGALTQGMKEYGWVDGQSITFEYRFVETATRIRCRSSLRSWFNCEWM
jgi:putative tryptophan/tyrosine transport system substrate-binding protein